MMKRCWTGRVLVGLLSAAIVFATGPTIAETTTDLSALPACKTGAGDDGLFFRNQFGVVHAPVAFDQVTTDPEKLWLEPAWQEGERVLAFGGPLSSEVADQDNAPLDAPILASVTFTEKDGTLVHQCGVEIVQFDPALHQLAQLQSGDCAMSLLAGRPQLLAGYSQTWETTLSLAEAFVSDPTVADLSTLSSSRIRMLGKLPGVFTLLWYTDGAEGVENLNICPMEVLAATDILGQDGPLDAELCKDVTGAAMRLKVGETAELALQDRDGRAFIGMKAAVANPGLVDFRFAESRTSATVTALAQGETSILFVGENGAVQLRCEVFVE